MPQMQKNGAPNFGKMFLPAGWAKIDEPVSGGFVAQKEFRRS